MFSHSIFADSRLAERPIDIVFDLDGVLIYSIEPATPPTGQIIKTPFSDYLLAEGAPELLAFLASIPKVRISFFSSVIAERNISVLNQIKLPNGESAFKIAHRILSASDKSADHTKDLRKLDLPDFSLDRAILVDDWQIHAAEGQRDNLLLVTPSNPIYDHDIKIGLNVPEATYAQKAGYDWNLELKRERDKLTRVAAMIDIAIKGSQHTGASVREMLGKLQYDTYGNYLYEETNSDAIFWKGQNVLGSANCVQILTQPHAH